MINFIKQKQKILLNLFLTTIALGAGYYIFVCTEIAPWGFSDSATYLSAARNFAAGQGLGTYDPTGNYSPLMIFAPFYSLFLSLFAWLKADLLAAIRWFDILSFSLLIFLSGSILYRITARFWFSILFAGLMAFSPALVVDFSSMMSEPLAIFLGIPGLLMVLLAVKENSVKWLIISALSIGLSILTRYAFLAFALAGMLILFFTLQKPILVRVKRSLLFAGVSLFPIVGWVSVQLFSGFSIGSRHYSLPHSMQERFISFFSQIYEVLKLWLPYRSNMIPGIHANFARPVLAILFVAVILFGSVLAIKNYKTISKTIFWHTILSAVISIVAYFMMLLVTFTISSELISLNERMLSPLIPLFYLLLLSSTATVDQVILPRQKISLLTFCFSAFFILYHFVPMRVYAVESRTYPNGYTSPIWMENEILHFEGLIPDDRPLVSNAPDLLLFYTNTNAYYLSRGSEKEGISISILDSDRIQHMMTDECAQMVLFDATQAELYERLANPITNQDILDLQNQFDVLYNENDGVILADQSCNY